MDYKSILKINLFLILFSLSLHPAGAMEDIEDTTPVLPHHSPTEQSHLLIQEVDDHHESSSARELHVINWTEKVRTINDRLQILRTPEEGLPLQTALVKYRRAQLILGEHEESRESETARPFLILRSLEPVVFDKQVEPRKIARCCASPVRTLLKWGGAAVGFVVVSLVNSGLKNGVYGNFFNPTNSHDSWYSPGGPVSTGVTVLSFVIDGPMGAKLGYDFVDSMLERPRSSLLRVQDEEVGMLLTEARLSQKPFWRRAFEVLLVPGVAIFGLLPVAPYLGYEKRYLPIALPFALVAWVYFGKPYYGKGKRILKKLYTDSFSSRDHRTKEIRRALDASLGELEDLLRVDKRTKRNKNKLLNSVWTILDERTRHFGKDGRIQDLDEEETASALSTLFLTLLVANESPENEYEKNWNNALAQQNIKEKLFKDRAAGWGANVVAPIAVYGLIPMVKYLISKPLQVYGVPQSIADPIGYTVAGLCVPRLLLDRQFHVETFTKIAHPLTPMPDDNVGVRTSLKLVYGTAYTAFNILFFYIAYQLSDAGVGPLSYLTLITTMITYLSLLYNYVSEEVDDMITDVQTRDTETPSLEQKRAQVNKFLKHSRELVYEDLSDYSGLELSKVIFRGN